MATDKSLFRNQYNYKNVVTDRPEPIKMKSKTIKGQSYTTKQLVELNKKGINPAILRDAIYEMDIYGEELNPLRKPNFDLTDGDRVLQEVKKFQDAIEAKKKQEKFEKDKEERRRIYEEVRNEIDKNKDGKLNSDEKLEKPTE